MTFRNQLSLHKEPLEFSYTFSTDEVNDLHNMRGEDDLESLVQAWHLAAGRNLVEKGQVMNAFTKKFLYILSSQILGWNDCTQGYILSGGSEANLQALYHARTVTGKNIVIADPWSHASIIHASDMLNMKLIYPDDTTYEAMMHCIEQYHNQIAIVVVTEGTTSFGTSAKHYLIDRQMQPSPLVKYCMSNVIMIHIDAAYGGYIKSLQTGGRDLIKAYEWCCCTMTIDPHKFVGGYGCGMLLFSEKYISFSTIPDQSIEYFTKTKHTLGTSRSPLPMLQAMIQMENLGYEGLCDLAHSVVNMARRVAKHIELLGYRLYVSSSDIDTGIISVSSNSYDDQQEIITFLGNNSQCVASIHEFVGSKVRYGWRVTISPTHKSLDWVVWKEFLKTLGKRK